MMGGHWIQREKGCAGWEIYGKAHKSRRSSCAEFKKSYYWMLQNVPIYLNVKYQIWLWNRWFSCILLNIRNWIYGHECGKGLFMHGNIQWKVYIQHKPREGTPLTYLIWWHPNFFPSYRTSISWPKRNSVDWKTIYVLTKLRKLQNVFLQTAGGCELKWLEEIQLLALHPWLLTTLTTLTNLTTLTALTILMTSTDSHLTLNWLSTDFLLTLYWLLPTLY